MERDDLNQIDHQGEISELTEFRFDDSGHFKVALTETKDIYFRIISGESDEKLGKLHGDPNRKIVFIGDAERLLEFNGKTPWQILMDIGHHPTYCAQDIASGMRYKIVVFKKKDERIELATWANLLKVVAEVHEKLEGVFASEDLLTGLMQCDISSIEWMDELPENEFSRIHNKGKNDPNQEPRFMTEERFKEKIDELKTQKENLIAQVGADLANQIYRTKLLVMTRLFLYNTVAIFRLFTGKGFSMEKRGNSQIETGPEYVYYMLNQSLKSIEHYIALEMHPKSSAS